MGGESSKPSWLVRRIRNILPEIKYTDCKETVRFSPVKLFGVPIENLDEELAGRLFAGDGGMSLSVTAMEKYVACPYRFFMENGIKAKPRARFTVENTDAGSLLHSLLELGAKKVLERNKKEVLTEEQCAEIIDSVTDKALAQVKNDALISTASSRFATTKLKKFAAEALYAVARQCSSDAYIPGGFEVEFGYNRPGSLPPVEILTPSGETVKIRGKIDRYDYWDYEGVRYYRIIDYKSYVENVTPSEIMVGSKMQLITYADALEKMAENDGLESQCGGVFYQNISSSRTKSGDYMLKGLFYDMDENIQAMVGDGGGGLGKKALNPDAVPGKCVRVPEGGFELLKNQTEENIQNISGDIRKGKIPVNPTTYGDKSPCEYCDFGHVCGFCGHVRQWEPEDSGEFFNKYLKKKAD